MSRQRGSSSTAADSWSEEQKQLLLAAQRELSQRAGDVVNDHFGFLESQYSKVDDYLSNPNVENLQLISKWAASLDRQRQETDDQIRQIKADLERQLNWRGIHDTSLVLPLLATRSICGNGEETQQQLDDLTNEFKSLEVSAADCKQKYDVALAELETARAQLTKSQTEVTNLQAKLSSSRAEVAAARDEVATAQAETIAARDETE